MLNFDAKEIEILRAGTFTANNGTSHTFRIDQLNEIAETYNPQHFKAPLIVSHDTQEHDDASLAESHLAYGFPSRLKVVGDRLKAVFGKIAPQFTQWVRDNQILSVSSSLYTPNSAANPYPGKWSLRHIAGLGKEPPAIKGMTPLSLAEFLAGEQEGAIAFDEFNTPEDGSILFSTADFGMSDRYVGQLMQRLREYLISKHDMEVANEVIPADMVQFFLSHTSSDEAALENLYMRVSALEEKQHSQPVSNYQYQEVNSMAINRLSKLMKDKGIDATAGARASGVSAEKILSYMEGKSKMSEGDRKRLAGVLGVSESDLMSDDETDLSEMQSELESARKEAETARLEASQALKQLKRLEIQSFCESLSTKITPAMLNVRELEFGESKAEIGLVDFMMGLSDEGLAFMQSHLNGLPEQVSFGEHAASGNPERPSITGGSDEMKERAELDKRIKAYMTEHSVSYSEAHGAITTEIRMGV